MGHFSRLFAEQNGVLVGVLIVETFMGNATVICSNNHDDWKASLGQIVGSLQEAEQNLSGGPTAGSVSIGGGVLTQSVACAPGDRQGVDGGSPSQ
jgi:hypothetical protein